MDTPIEDIFELIHYSETIKCEVCDIFIKKCGMKAHRRSRKHKVMEMLMEPDPVVIRVPPELRCSPLLI